MKRIFHEKILRINKSENTYESGRGFMVNIVYSESEFKKTHSKEFITGLCFDGNDNVILRVESLELDNPYYVITNNEDDRKALSIIISALVEKNTLYTNFNPHTHSSGNMIFVDVNKDNKHITGIGVDVFNRYVLQESDVTSEKYNNSIIYKAI